MKAQRRLGSLFAVAGAIIGYLVFHPYTMLVYMLTHPHEGRKLLVEWQWRELLSSSFSTFQPAMLPMALAFTALGALVGFLLGIALSRKKRLLLAELENAKRKAAIETLHALMVTLSHYLLNSSVIIGGKARRCMKLETRDNILDHLQAIEEQAKKIDVVVSILRDITKIKTVQYTVADTSALIDITKELERQLSAAGRLEENGS